MPNLAPLIQKRWEISPSNSSLLHILTQNLVNWCVDCKVQQWVGCEPNIFTARKQSLGQGNIFTPICHSVHRRRCLVPGVPGPGGAWSWGVYLVPGGVPGPKRGVVILFTGGGAWSRGCLVPGGVPGPGECTWSQGVCLVPREGWSGPGYAWSWGEGVWSGGTPSVRLLLRAVHILLECIFVVTACTEMFTQ